MLLAPDTPTLKQVLVSMTPRMGWNEMKPDKQSMHV